MISLHVSIWLHLVQNVRAVVFRYRSCLVGVLPHPAVKENHCSLCTITWAALPLVLFNTPLHSENIAETTELSTYTDQTLHQAWAHKSFFTPMLKFHYINTAQKTTQRFKYFLLHNIVQSSLLYKNTEIDYSSAYTAEWMIHVKKLIILLYYYRIFQVCLSVFFVFFFWSWSN